MYINPDHHLPAHISPTPRPGQSEDFSSTYDYQIRRCSSSSTTSSEPFGARLSMSRRSLPHMRLPLPAVLNGQRPPGSSIRQRSKSPRPSVVVMKKLMPLRLSSIPSMAEEEVQKPMDENWPLPTAQYTPTRDGHDSDSTSLTTDRSSLSTAQSTDSFRDIPYCMKPGLPSPSRVYFTKQDQCLKCLAPGSPCRISCVGVKYQNLEDEDYFTDCAEDFDHDCNDCDDSDGPNTMSYDSSRDSSLSIKCMGQRMVVDEASWLGNSIYDDEQSPESVDSCDEESDSTSILSFDSGTSRWTPPPQHNEVFEHATALSPAKAHVVHVRKSSFPPRQSSLFHQDPNSTDSPETPEFHNPCFFHPFTHITPPASPEDAITSTETSDSEDYNSTPRASHLAPPKSHYSSPLALDPAFSSPPASPSRTIHSSSSYLHLTPIISSNSSVHSSLSTPSSYSTSSTSTNPLTPTTRSLLTAIITATDGFPSTMLLPTSPCIARIRSQTHRPTLDSTAAAPNPTSALTRPSKPSKPAKLRRKSKTTALFSPLKSASTTSVRKASTTSQYSDSPAYWNSYTDDIDTSHVPPPNLAPLERIFPSTTPFMCTALYAHLVALNFCADVQRALEERARMRMPEKAARVMGVEGGEGAGYGYGYGEREEVEGIVEGVREVVCRLIGGMGGEVRGGATGGFVVALGEVVRLCERG